jgi:DNA polymerase-3 subunit alpha
MEGVVRNAGTHAAGVIITDKPIIDYIPLHRPTGSSANESPVKTITQFEMNVLDSLGLLKVDFLGLATLTIMARACQMIQARHGVALNLDNIPTDDEDTYALMGRGETAGVFQVEGSGMRRYLMQMKPKELANVIAMVALFRPGPMDFIPGYIRRMHSLEDIEYRHPLLESIFKETYGYPVYQEQLMFAVMKLADYTASEADDLRKAIAKKMPDKLVKHREKFIKGAIKKDIPAELAAEIFDDWEEFARYGFNKSHAVDYGIIAVQTAYLKVHYTVEYMTALLSVTKNDTDKVALYVADCRRMGISVEPPDINVSDWDFVIEDCTDGSSVIRFGMGGVKNVGQGAVETILKARGEKTFENLNDFARRVDLRHVGKRALECLVKVGALDRFGPRTALLETLDRILAVSAAHFRAAETGQMSLFGAHTGVVDDISLPAASVEISRREILNWERELIGLYVSDHPLSPVMQDLQEIVTHYSGQLNEVNPEEKVRVAGLITRVRHHQTKTGKPMAFVTIEDLQGIVELVVFPRTWEKVSGIIEPERIVLVDGRVDASGAEAKILVDHITDEFSRVVPLADLDVFPTNARHSNKGFQTQKSTDRINEIAAKPKQSGGIPAQRNGESPYEQVEEVETSFPINSGDSDVPPMPEDPPDWDIPGIHMPQQDQEDIVNMPLLEGAEIVSLPEGSEILSFERIDEAAVAEEDSPLASVLTQEDLITAVDVTQSNTTDAVSPPPMLTPSVRGTQGDSRIDERSLGLPPYLVSPLPGKDKVGEVRMLTVVMRSTGDRTRDVLRLRRIHGIITSYPGEDRFAFHVFERGRGYLLEFPNITIGISKELVERLTTLIGMENVRIDQITFQ